MSDLKTELNNPFNACSHKDRCISRIAELEAERDALHADRADKILESERLSYELDTALKERDEARAHRRIMLDADPMKTLVEIESELTNCRSERDAALETLENVKAVDSEWISVNDRLPDDKKDYQVYCDDTKEQMVGFHIGDGLFQYAITGYSGPVVCRPAHWMPLPEPPAIR